MMETNTIALSLPSRESFYVLAGEYDCILFANFSSLQRT